jgi:hypothetical protein
MQIIGNKKNPVATIPSDFVRSEYVLYDENFDGKFTQFLDGVLIQENYYEMLSDQLEKNPVLALDYLRRAYLITGNELLRKQASRIIKDEGLSQRAKNSVEILAANF